MVTQVTNKNTQVPANWDRRGLPAWSYHSPALLELEKEKLFKTHWQIACHVSDIPETGSYFTFDLCGERALLVKGNDDEIRAFHNICRHRGSRLVATERGKCKSAMICPFHGWVYNLDGTLRGAAKPDSFPPMDKLEFALKPLEAEVWNGFVFVRFEKGPQPSVAALMNRVSEEAAGYHIDELVPAGQIWTEETPVNWKSIRDVDNEGYHVAMAHPALQDLYGPNYYDEPYVDGVSRSCAEFSAAGGRRWSVKNYLKFTKPHDHIPEGSRNVWSYFGIFPNNVIAMTPETALFYQEFPVSTNKSVIRSCTYHHPKEDRQQRAARYLSSRIDRETVEEDVQLTIWSNESMASKNFEGFYLSDLEYGVRTHHDHLRNALPIFNLEERPTEEEVWSLNETMAQAAE